jgi:Spy/CpxP family protein refolding chaperone
MKKNWLTYLVIFSLALNVGILGALVYFRLQPPPDPLLLHEGRPPEGFKGLLHSLNLDPEQQQLLKQNFPTHRQQIKELRQQLHQQRQKLYEFIDQARPDESEIAAQITVINNLQNALEQEMVRFLLQIKQNLRPEQQEMLLQRVGQRLCGPGFCGPHKTGGKPGRGMDRCRDNQAPPPPPGR